MTAEAEPAAAVGVRYSRGSLELMRGQDREALAAYEAAERLAGHLNAPHLVVPRARALQVFVLVRLGDADGAEQVLAGLGERERERGDVRLATAAVLLARDDPGGAAATLAPVLNGSTSLVWLTWLIQAFLLEAIARDALGDQAAAGRALERALDLAEPDGWLMPFLLHPAKALLERHSRHRAATPPSAPRSSLGFPEARPSPRRPDRHGRRSSPLSGSELRVLRYLPTNLTAPEIAGEMYLSVNTVRTHVGNLYTKLGVHSRAEAVTRARHLGLLAPSALGTGRRSPRSGDCHSYRKQRRSVTWQVSQPAIGGRRLSGEDV